jgi:hypothetical protein
MRVNLVRFAPGARTHPHVLGQTLHVVSGVALVGTRDGAILEAHPARPSAARPARTTGTAPSPTGSESPGHVGRP